MQPLPAPEPGPLTLLDRTEGFTRRKRTSLCFAGALLAQSLLTLAIGLAATTRVENVSVGGYHPGIILGFGAFLGMVGVSLENRKQMLVAAIVIISFGLVAAVCCATVDGMIATQHIEPGPLMAGRCQFFSSAGHQQDVYQAEVTCHSVSDKCQLKVKSNTCYCCDLYPCHSAEHLAPHYVFTGVRSCVDVLHLYRLLWALVVLNVLGLLLAVLTAAMLGAFKDVVPLPQLAFSSPHPPHVLCNPTQQALAIASLCPVPALPTRSSYPLPLQPDWTQRAHGDLSPRSQQQD
ncbi:transmembrane protein 255B [Erinaceus europaeus]|uniref:Transmembrane protein 255B n=1 Tax=Erinaceus europaeus TaxID=9365 RepID=A0A1S3AMW0_ERIEU|nr:transmembrane protein 255B [Erinaceus europaeus]